MSGTQRQIRHGGRSYPVIDEIRIGRHRLAVIERLGGGERPPLRVYEPGAVGQMRYVRFLPSGRATMRRLRLLAKVSAAHSNLPHIVDSVRHDGEVVVILKWIDGPSLRDYLQQCRRGKEPWPSPLIVVNLIKGLAHGCRMLHDRLGVIHGDLHPDNLVLCRHTKRLVPIDFGSAWKVETTSKRDSGDGVARPYAAPELQSGKGAAGAASDQFSVMSICYEMLTGKIPYDGLGGRASVISSDEGGVELDGVGGQLKHAGKLPAALTTGLDEVLCRGLAPDPRDRFTNTSDWIAVLEKLAEELKTPPGMSKANRWFLRQLSRLEPLFARAKSNGNKQ